MREVLIIAGPLTLVLLVLTWPPSDRPPPRPPRHRVDAARTEHRQVRHEAPRLAGEHRWIASDHESRWHLRGQRPFSALCGHRLRGPVATRLGPHPPSERRTTCETCRHAADLPVESPYRPAARLALLQPGEPCGVNASFGRSHRLTDAFTADIPATIEWPSRDPDEDDDTPELEADTPSTATVPLPRLPRENHDLGRERSPLAA